MSFYLLSPITLSQAEHAPPAQLHCASNILLLTLLDANVSQLQFFNADDERKQSKSPTDTQVCFATTCHELGGFSFFFNNGQDTSVSSRPKKVYFFSMCACMDVSTTDKNDASTRSAHEAAHLTYTLSLCCSLITKRVMRRTQAVGALFTFHFLFLFCIF